MVKNYNAQLFCQNTRRKTSSDREDNNTIKEEKKSKPAYNSGQKQ
jgi:hypothetical protein